MVVVVVVVGTLGCGISFALAGRPLLGVLLGPVLALGVAFWYGQRILLPATVQASPTQLTIEQEEVLIYYINYLTGQGIPLTSSIVNIRGQGPLGSEPWC